MHRVRPGAPLGSRPHRHPPRRAARVAVGGDPFGEAPIEVPVGGRTWGDQVRGEAAAAVAAWTAADLEVIVAVPWGQVPGWAALAGYVQESTVHAWDLAVASRGRVVDLGLDPSLVSCPAVPARNIG